MTKLNTNPIKTTKHNSTIDPIIDTSTEAHQTHSYSTDIIDIITAPWKDPLMTTSSTHIVLIQQSCKILHATETHAIEQLYHTLNLFKPSILLIIPNTALHLILIHKVVNTTAIHNYQTVNAKSVLSDEAWISWTLALVLKILINLTNFNPVSQLASLDLDLQNLKIVDFPTPRRRPVRVGLGWMRERVPKSGTQKWYPLSGTFRSPSWSERWHSLCQNGHLGFAKSHTNTVQSHWLKW